MKHHQHYHEHTFPRSFVILLIDGRLIFFYEFILFYFNFSLKKSTTERADLNTLLV
jgi:hypothetical protein